MAGADPSSLRYTASKCPRSHQRASGSEPYPTYSSPSGSLPCKAEKTPPSTQSTAVSNSQFQDLAIEDMEHWGILRRFDPRQIAMDLISEGKTGWEPDDSKPSTENLSNFFLRYTLGRGDQPLTMQAKGLETWPQTYEATLVTCLSAEVYVGRGLSEMHAKRMAAAQFFRDEEVRKVFPLLPATQAHIRSKAVLYTEEKRECKAHGVSPDAMRDIVARRIADVLECFHDMGYRTDIWDGNC